MPVFGSLPLSPSPATEFSGAHSTSVLHLPKYCTLCPSKKTDLSKQAKKHVCYEGTKPKPKGCLPVFVNFRYQLLCGTDKGPQVRLCLLKVLQPKNQQT